MSQLEVITLPVASLRPYSRNARTHCAKQIAQIAASIRTFGFNNPVLIDKDGVIIAGHGRVAAAKSLGLDSVPVIRLEHMSEAQKRAYILADNKLAEKAGWDSDILAIELQNLLDFDLDFDLSITGFEMPEIDVLIGGLDSRPAKPDPADAVSDVVGPAITRLGDIWQIGPHRLICGDALKREAFTRLLDGDLAQMVFTDPPYNVRIDGHVSGLGKAQHREFAMASGEMSVCEFTAFLKSVFGNLVEASTDGAMHFVAMDWRHMAEVLEAGRTTYSELKNLCVWSKTNGYDGERRRKNDEGERKAANGSQR